jgi:hypothetical protein
MTRPDGDIRQPAAAGEPLAMICGGGSFPGAVADAVARSGRRPIIFGIAGWADPTLASRFTYHSVTFGQVGKMLEIGRAERCRDVVLIGTFLRPPVLQTLIDWQLIRLLPRIVRAYRGGDDRLLSAVARIIEEFGFRLVGVDQVAPDIVVPEGVLGRRQPSARDRADIARALDVINALGPYDVGQAAIVADNHVLAVEAAEGTDHMIARIAELRQRGRVVTPLGVGVLVKAPKRGQDRRIDLPAIGRQTVENVVRAGLAGIAVAAGGAIMADGPELIAAADKSNVFVMGVRERPSS